MPEQDTMACCEFGFVLNIYFDTIENQGTRQTSF